MYGKVKLTKRDLKEDKFATFMLTSKSRLQDSWQFVVIGIVIAVLFVVAMVFYMDSQDIKASEAGQKMSRAMIDYRSGNNQVAILTLNQLLEEYADDPVINDATYMLGKINYSTRNYSEAIRYWELYLKNFSQDLLYRASALAGIGACYEDQGDYVQAAQQFSNAIDEYPEGPQVGDYAFNAMRNYLTTGDKKLGRAFYERIKEDFRGTLLAQKADRTFAEKYQN